MTNQYKIPVFSGNKYDKFFQKNTIRPYGEEKNVKVFKICHRRNRPRDGWDSPGLATEQLIANRSWVTFSDERFDKNCLTSIEFENIFYRSERNLNDILGEKGDDKELERIRMTIDRIIELSK
jgi:hypothetical protein